ncbi:hypothetical protein MKK69_25440 [Methylobacterium sp. J-026]|uniref:hypothetical protein n=1 Tax=Methylobacterium sp. J-026 TaxID=2836624 RepID=UPI001FBB0FC2|nr:hypothetical protein [Methylobacterium sp. J-026]MCJ2137348.1 hypothetical protein [Methylobacterium sp. J-026]
MGVLIEKVAKAREPSRPLFAEVWFATTGQQDPDTKVRFAFFMQSKAWTDAALITLEHALPEWGVVARSGPGPGEAKLQPPGMGHAKRPAGLEPVRHPGGAALAILQATLHAKAGGF